MLNLRGKKINQEKTEKGNNNKEKRQKWLKQETKENKADYGNHILFLFIISSVWSKGGDRHVLMEQRGTVIPLYSFLVWEEWLQAQRSSLKTILVKSGGDSDPGWRKRHTADHAVFLVDSVAVLFNSLDICCLTW